MDMCTDTNGTKELARTRRQRDERPVHPCTRDLVFSLATCGSLFVLSSWTMTGCSTGAKTNEQRTAQRRTDSTAPTMTPKNTAKNDAMGKAGLSVRGPESSEPAHEGQGLMADLVSTVDTDRAMLARMAKESKTTYAGTSNALTASTASTTMTDTTAGELPPQWNGFRMASVEPKVKTYLPDGTPTMMSWSSPAGGATGTMPTPSMWAGAGWNGRTNGGFTNNHAAMRMSNSNWSHGNSANTTTVANAGNREMTSDPMQLSNLLAQAFASTSSASMDPMRVWFIYSSLAVSNPDINLPEGFGNDLLPAERERIMAAHAGFSALGRAFRDGATKVDAPIRQALVAALTGEPALAIPRMDLCTKVVGFGDYAPMRHRRFVVGGNSRVIVYSELDGFKSNYENGKWTTKLATRVSIVPSDTTAGNYVAWSRTPEWTDVTDSSDEPRCEFFLGEIIPIANTLVAGNYKVKVEVKDLASGATTMSYLPIEVLTPAAFALAEKDLAAD